MNQRHGGLLDVEEKVDLQGVGGPQMAWVLGVHLDNGMADGMIEMGACQLQ